MSPRVNGSAEREGGTSRVSHDEALPSDEFGRLGYSGIKSRFSHTITRYYGERGDWMKDHHRFYVCKKDGTLLGVIHDGGGELLCCGQPMQELIANTTEGAQEKHLPVVKREGDTVLVEVGSVPHPMSEEHSIQWVYLLTAKGGQRKSLPFDSRPVVQFRLTDDDEPVSVYAYCNLHGLWKTDV